MAGVAGVAGEATTAQRSRQSAFLSEGPYDSTFYSSQCEGSLRSARVVVGLLLDAMPVRSVVDVGCGLGTWLAAFMERGVVDVDGYDGAYVDRSGLLIPRDRFHAVDLTIRLPLARRYDLAVCLEVGEHLPDGAAPVLVESLVRASDVVLFSAAVPGQGGTHHVNEQWPAYWDALFRVHGYAARDWLRPAVWCHRSVEWWYAQNTLLFARADALARNPLIDRGAPADGGQPAPLVHPSSFAALNARLTQVPRVCEALRTLGRSAGRALQRRLGLGGPGR